MKHFFGEGAMIRFWGVKLPQIALMVIINEKNMI